MKRNHIFGLCLALLSSAFFDDIYGAADAGTDAATLTPKEQLVRAIQAKDHEKTLALVANEDIAIAEALGELDDNALHIAALSNWGDVVDVLLERSDFENFIDQTDMADNTAVALAFVRGNMEIVTKLLEYGADRTRLLEVREWRPRKANLKKLFENMDARGLKTKPAR